MSALNFHPIHHEPKMLTDSANEAWLSARHNHPPLLSRFCMVIAVTEENKICLTRKQVNDMRNDRPAISPYQRLWQDVACAPKTLAKSRHWNGYLHRGCLDAMTASNIL